MRGLFVTGTDTGVGKTLVTAAIAAALRAEGWQAGVWKPVQSGALLGSGNTDAERLVRLAGIPEPPEAVAPYTFEAPLAPLLAAGRAGVTLTLQALIAAGKPLAARSEALLIEGAGGAAVPLTEDALVADLIAQLQVPALIVARSGLGTINHTLMTAAFLRHYGIPVAGVILNDGAGTVQDDPSVATNAEMIARYGGLRIIGRFPRLGPDVSRDILVHTVRQSIDLEAVRQALKLTSKSKFMEGPQDDDNGI